MAADRKRGVEPDPQEQAEMHAAIQASYEQQQDILYGAARGWIDRIIEPHRTREELMCALQIAASFPIEKEFKTGVIQT